MTETSAYDRIIPLAADAVGKIKNVKVENVESASFEVHVTAGKAKGDSFKIELDQPDTPYDEEEMNVGKRPKKKWGKHKVVTGHFDVLEIMLDALTNDESLVEQISDLTTDGDNHDCEAIFHLKEEDDYFILKVR